MLKFRQITGTQKEHSSQHSRATSPRRLIKQVALESPPTNASDELSTSHHHHHHLKVIPHDMRSDRSSAREESYLTQRQRLRKTGPFAVDSQQLPDTRSKYAGSWAPQAPPKDGTESQDDDNDVEAYSSEKQVCR